MSSSGPDKVSVRVEVVVEGGKATSVETQTQDKAVLALSYITFPQPCPPKDTWIVQQSNGTNYIQAWGGSPTINNKLPSKVWALAYSMPGVSTLTHPTPDNGAISVTPTENGQWSFMQTENNPVPGANCDGNACGSGGANNSTLIVWWDYGTPGSPNYAHVESTPFHGYCPGSGMGAFASKPTTVSVGSYHLATALHATFTGVLAKLGTVLLSWNGVSWAGESSAGGGLVLSLQCHDSIFQLMAAGPGTIFIVAGKPKLCPRFSWSAEGVARGALAGHFTVTIVE